MPFCPNCGASVEGRFCAKCGTAVEAAPPQQQAQSSYTPPAQQPPPYTPPQSAQSYPPPPSAQPYTAGSSGLTDNLAATLSYLMIPAIVFLVIEPYNRSPLVRFHAFQALFMFVAWIAYIFVMMLVTGIIPMIGLLLWPLTWLLWLALLGITIFLMVKAYNNEQPKLPIIGDMAAKQV